MYALKSKKIIALVSCIFTLWLTPSLATIMPGNGFFHNFEGNPRIPNPDTLVKGILQQYQGLSSQKNTNFPGIVRVLTYNPQRGRFIGSPSNQDALTDFQKELEGMDLVLFNAKVVGSGDGENLIIEVTGRVTNVYGLPLPQYRTQMNHLAQLHFKHTGRKNQLSMINIIHGKHHEGFSAQIEDKLNAEIESLVKELRELQNTR